MLTNVRVIAETNAKPLSPRSSQALGFGSFVCAWRPWWLTAPQGSIKVQTFQNGPYKMHLRSRSPDGVISVFIGESFLNKVGWGQSQINHHSSLQQVELPATVEMERQWSSLRISKAWVDGHCLQEQPSNTKCLESPGRLTPCMLASRQCGKRWRPFLGSFWTMVIMACAHEAESPFTRKKT